MQLGAPVSAATPDWPLVASEFAELLAEPADLDAPPATPLSAILDGELEAVEEKLENARKYAARLGADRASAPNGHVFVNGKHFELDDDVLRNVQMTGTQMFQHLQEQVRALSCLPFFMLTRLAGVPRHFD